MWEESSVTNKQPTMFIFIAIVGFLATASAKDLIVGEGGELIYQQNVTESPALWRRVQNVTLEAPDVITRIAIIDHREDKNGEVQIIEGGVGSTNVTIELKSPAVFRGFDFEIQIYAKAVEGHRSTVNNDNETNNSNVEKNENPASKDIVNVNVKTLVDQVITSSTTQLPVIQDIGHHPIEAAKDEIHQVRPIEQGQEQPLRPLFKNIPSSATHEDLDKLVK